MNRNTDTACHHRRAIFLVAIMVGSVVGSSILFAGAVTADHNVRTNTELSGIIYAGESFDVRLDTTSGSIADSFSSTEYNNEAYLVRVDEQSGDGTITSVTAVDGPYENASSTAGSTLFTGIDTAGLETGTYTIANNSNTAGDFGHTNLFSINQQDLSATWQANSANAEDTEVNVTLDSGRDAIYYQSPPSKYNITVSADRLNDSQLGALFAGPNYDSAPDAADNYLVDDASQIPFDALGYTRGVDTRADIRADGYITLDLGESHDAGLYNNNGDQELVANFSRLAQQESFPGEASYNFKFVVTDTKVTAANSINIQGGKLIPPVYNFQIPNDGGVYTVGFPAPLNGTVSDALNQPTQDIGAETTVYVYENGGWVSKDTTTLEPEALDAIAIVTDGDDGEDVINLEMRFETTNLPTPGDVDVSSGWNFVSAPSYTTTDNVFAVGQAREVFNPFDHPPSNNIREGEDFLNHRMGSSSPPYVSPFAGYFIYIEQADAIQTGLAGGVVDRPQSNEYLNISCC